MNDSIGDNLFYRSEYLQSLHLFTMIVFIKKTGQSSIPNSDHIIKFNFFPDQNLFFSKNRQLSKNRFKFTIKAFYRTFFLLSQGLNIPLFAHSSLALKPLNRSL